jgi:hypothetical protein
LEFASKFANEKLLLGQTHKFIKKQLQIYGINESTNVNICPNCNRYILTKCANCDIEICSICKIILRNDDHHICDQELSNLDFVANWTKPCPKCFLRIEKTEGGCDQMFCVKCQTTFSWTSGIVADCEEIRHNPHFFEMKRAEKNLERQPGDIECKEKFDKYCHEIEDGNFYLLIDFLLHNTLLGIESVSNFEPFVQQDLRIKYLGGMITETTWRNKYFSTLLTKKRNVEILYLICFFLETFYQIVIFENDCQLQLENLFAIFNTTVGEIQTYYKKKTRYEIGLKNIQLPYMFFS